MGSTTTQVGPARPITLDQSQEIHYKCIITREMNSQVLQLGIHFSCNYAFIMNSQVLQLGNSYQFQAIIIHDIQAQMAYMKKISICYLLQEDNKNIY